MSRIQSLDARRLMTCPSADIGVDHGGVGDDGLRFAVRDDATGVHADETLYHPKQNVHDVFDPDDRQAATAQHLNCLDEAVGFFVRQPTANFVEQHHLWRGAQCSRQFQSFAIEQAQRFSLAVGEMKHLAKPDRIDATAIGAVARQAAPRHRRDEAVLKHRHTAEWSGNLVRAGYAETATPSGVECRHIGAVELHDAAGRVSTPRRGR